MGRKGITRIGYKIGGWLLFLLLVPLFCGKIDTLENDNTFIPPHNINFLDHLPGPQTDKYPHSVNSFRIKNIMQTHTTHKNNKHWKSKKFNNRIQHSINGNYHLNILHWNKGNTKFKNKITHIHQFLDEFRPHILSLCEANIEKTINNMTNENYKDYKIEHTKMADKTNNSRNVIMIKNDLVYDKRQDLEDDETSTVWIELKIPKQKSVLIASIYRQWSLPKALGILKSNNMHNQYNRWTMVLDKWTRAYKEKKEIIVLTDDNIDHNNSTFNTNYKVGSIKDMTVDFLTSHNYTTHNDEHTYYIRQDPTSCIDHIYSNCPQKITGVTTHNTGKSDHSILTAIYHTKAPIAPRRQYFTRKKHKLTKHALNQYLEHNYIIKSAFTYTDPNLIADVVMSELNNIIEIIAPCTVKQERKMYAPYIDTNLRNKQRILQKLYNKAKRTKNNEDWLNYKNKKSNINKEAAKQRKKYIANKINSANDRWKALKDINNKNQITAPRNIIKDGKIYNNPQDICNIANNYYIDTIKKLREQIPNNPVRPVDVLKEIYPRNDNTFNIPLPSVEDIRNIITKAPNSYSTGHDNISMDIIKKTIDTMAPIITHLTTHIILKKTFPDTFKIDKIAPQHKTGKPIYDMGSYRPINNLCTIEKIIEEYFIMHLEAFLIENKIINDNHHGGRKGHSTITALNQILNTTHINYEKIRLNCILITDMSKAYDTIDHFTLLSKLEYYGIRGPALDIFTSYLTNRRQFVQFDTKRSHLLQSLECSVIQGSKLSGLLYTLYTNEIPLLHKLMHNEIYTALTGQEKINKGDVDHTTVNFVDDSTNIISTHDTKTIERYLEKFYNLLEAVYNINKLKINKDKTELMIVCKQKFRKETKNIKMTASGYRVKQVTKAKILGYTLSNDLKHDKHLSALTANINNRLYNIRKVSNNSTIESRKILTKAIVIGKINYCLPLLCNARKAEITNLNTLITKSCRTIMGSRCPRWA